MEIIDTYAQEITINLNYELSFDEVKSMIEKPKYNNQGDLAFPCFTLAKKKRQSPHIIAKKMAEEVMNPLFDKIEAKGPYVNCFLNKRSISKDILNTILLKGVEYGSFTFGQGKNMVIDFSSPNIAKPFSMGHLRSTVIGNSISRIAEKCGYNTIKINHLGDWGTQFGKLIVAYKKWGSEEKVKEAPIGELLNLYVKFHKEADINSALNSNARTWFKYLEEGNKEAETLWLWFREESLKEFSKVYQLLDVDFDFFHGEAFYNDKMENTVKVLHENQLIVESDGARVVNLDEFNLPPCLIKKKDGATLYATRDLTAAIYRYNTYKFEKAVYVVGHEQSLHFQQIFKVLEMLGYKWANRLEHVPFGFILKEGKKMSTRKGKVVLLEDVIKEAIRLAKRNIEYKNPELQNKDEVAKAVGVGAIIFHDLKNERINNIEFSLEDMVKFEGSTGPYIQYTYSRATSILQKANLKDNFFVIHGLNDIYSWAVIKLLAEFPDTVKKSHYQNEPSVIAKYLISLCQEFNKYYGQIKILKSDDEQHSRIALVKSVSLVLKEGLNLLGIKAPINM